jgi:hypothetical protein
VASAAQVLPSRFEAGQVYVTPTTKSGDSLLLYTDTGGGGAFLLEAAAKRLALNTIDVDEARQKEQGLPPGGRRIPMPEFAAAKSIPAPRDNEGRLLVMPDATAAQELPAGIRPFDGMLGQSWFAGRIWTWDYPGQQFRVESDNWRAPSGMRRIPLGFKTGSNGKRLSDFPRMEIRIDGQTLPMLLDTGAMTLLTPAAHKTLADSLPAERATSMIASSIFQSWRSAHPEWRVIEQAQTGTGSAMIEVPEVEIAGQRVGPVWFTQRPDRAFHEYMSGMMDARVEGAIGGNVFEHFVMTVDYPHATAYFRCARDCR